jgi:hypothetical protein
MGDEIKIKIDNKLYSVEDAKAIFQALKDVFEPTPAPVHIWYPVAYPAYPTYPDPMNPLPITYSPSTGTSNGNN